MKFSKLSFPQGLNLGVLSEFLSEKDLKALILKHLNEPRLKRRIILPSARTVKKVVAHYYGLRVEQKKMTWKHLHFRDNWLLCSGQRFWEIAAATIEERLRLYGSKTRCFCPSVSKATRIKASLSSPSERNHARSAFLTVFHHTAIAKQGTRRSRASSMSERSELRRCREERMENGVKNLKGARLFPKTFSNHGFKDASKE